MKKILSAILVLLLLGNIGVCSFAYEGEDVDFKPLLTNIFTDELDYPSEWKSNDALRSLLAVTLYADVLLEYPDLADDFGTESISFDGYFADISGVYAIHLFTDEDLLLIFYDPDEETASYSVTEECSRKIVVAALKSEDYRYWELDQDSVSEAADYLSDLIDNL